MTEELSPRVERVLHEIFEVGLSLKAFNGTWETLSGLGVLLLNTQLVHRILRTILRSEILENPRDIITSLGLRFAQIPGGARTFAAIYIMIHGVLNLFLAIQLYRNRLWAYLVTMGFSAMFILYQIYQISLYHSRILTVLTVLDVCFFVLTYHEYLHQRKKHGTVAPL